MKIVLDKREVTVTVYRFITVNADDYDFTEIKTMLEKEGFTYQGSDGVGDFITVTGVKTRYIEVDSKKGVLK